MSNPDATRTGGRFRDASIASRSRPSRIGGSSAASIGVVGGKPTSGARVAVDTDSKQWVEQLRAAGHPRHDRAVAKLHDVLLRVALHELSRRRGQLRSITGPEFDDLAQQAANDALMNILVKLDEFRGLSRFTTWAYKFVMFEVSSKVARHAWRRQPPGRRSSRSSGYPTPWRLGQAIGSNSESSSRPCRPRSAS